MTTELEWGLEGGEIDGPLVLVSAYVHNPNHQTEAEDRLLTQFDDKPKIHAWTRALVKPLQTLEDMFNALRGAFDPYTAVGDQLDRVGGIVDEERANRSDSAYRPYVLARIAVNNSDGAPKDIYKVARLILGDKLTYGHALRIEGVFPAKYILHITGAGASYAWDPSVSPSTVATAIADLVTQATSGGVGVLVHYQTADDANTFTFASGDTVETDANQGFADDAGAVGGQLTDYVEGTDV